jgi:hypothetical protein
VQDQGQARAIAQQARVGGASVTALLLLVVLKHGLSRLPRARAFEILGATAGGLLSSSCCVIQLALNAFGLGCAGFAALDRWRPLTLSLTFSSLLLKAANDLRHRTFKPWPPCYRRHPQWCGGSTERSCRSQARGSRR